MPFPIISISETATLNSDQGVEIRITVTGLSTLADKIVTLSFNFANDIANNGSGNPETAFFAKFVPAAANSTTFTFIAPFPQVGS